MCCDFFCSTPQEKSAIQVFFDQSVGRLKGSDRALPQVLIFNSYFFLFQIQGVILSICVLFSTCLFSFHIILFLPSLCERC